MSSKKEIIERLEKLSGKYSMYEVFSDWIKCSAISISNSVEMIESKVWREREAEYIRTISRYDKEEQKILCEMTGLL